MTLVSVRGDGIRSNGKCGGSSKEIIFIIVVAIIDDNMLMIEYHDHQQEQHPTDDPLSIRVFMRHPNHRRPNQSTAAFLTKDRFEAFSRILFTL